MNSKVTNKEKTSWKALSCCAYFGEAGVSRGCWGTEPLVNPRLAQSQQFCYVELGDLRHTIKKLVIPMPISSFIIHFNCR